MEYLYLPSMTKKFRVGIIGGTAFTSRELVALLLKHPQVEIAWLSSTSQAGTPISSIFPQWTGALGPWEVLRSLEDVKNDPIDVVFSCLPHAASAENCAHFIGKAKIIDLSADFRLSDTDLYQKTYDHVHPMPSVLKDAVYGLADLYAEKIAKASIVGNPGCYPTSILLPLLPLIAEGYVAGQVIVDSKSGVSGAGRTPTATTHYNNANESVAAYKTGRTHRHVAEIEEQASEVAGKKFPVVFSPHLMPMDRGILSSLYIPIKPGLTLKDIEDVYGRVYANSPFVFVVKHYPSTKEVAYTNRCHFKLQLMAEQNLLLVFSVIDNLIKGASGQAMQNMNLVLGLPPSMGFV